MKIGVYCSASRTLDEKYYEIGRNFGKEMAKRGHSLVYGGYDEGIMGAVAKEIANANGELIGVIPEVFHTDEFTYDKLSKVIYTDTMSNRKKVMEDESDAFAILPGGIGTFDEFFEAYVLSTLNQLHKPIAIYNAYGCYDLLIAFLKQNHKEGFINDTNINMLHVFDNEIDLLNFLEKN